MVKVLKGDRITTASNGEHYDILEVDHCAVVQTINPNRCLRLKQLFGSLSRAEELPPVDYTKASNCNSATYQSKSLHTVSFGTSFIVSLCERLREIGDTLKLSVQSGGASGS